MRDVRAKSDRQSDALAAALRSRFALSDAEIQVVMALAGGHDLARIGQMRKVSRHTVRTQLKAIFHKTGAKSQVQLLLLVMRL